MRFPHRLRLVSGQSANDASTQADISLPGEGVVGDIKIPVLIVPCRYLHTRLAACHIACPGLSMCLHSSDTATAISGRV